ncbi:MAG: winged helix-turn-helix transcriptional regulator [Peptococcaceae bacterium]|nr:winged helix-turn-helix transcriptional regulator [Peptococcaceae bacterium]
MRENPSISKKRISEKTGIATRTVDRVIFELKQRQIIYREGANKGGKWVVR